MLGRKPLRLLRIRASRTAQNLVGGRPLRLACKHIALRPVFAKVVSFKFSKNVGAVMHRVQLSRCRANNQSRFLAGRGFSKSSSCDRRLNSSGKPITKSNRLVGSGTAVEADKEVAPKLRCQARKSAPSVSPSLSASLSPLIPKSPCHWARSAASTSPSASKSAVGFAVGKSGQAHTTTRCHNPVQGRIVRSERPRFRSRHQRGSR